MTDTDNRITPAEVRNMAGWMDREGRRADVEVGDDAGEPWYALGARLIELATQMEADAIEALHFMTEYQYVTERNKVLETERDTFAAKVKEYEERMKGRVSVQPEVLQWSDGTVTARTYGHAGAGSSGAEAIANLQRAIDEEVEHRG